MDSFISVKLSPVEAYRDETGLTQWQSGNILTISTKLPPLSTMPVLPV
jgi:hypothetical protein